MDFHWARGSNLQMSPRHHCGVWSVQHRLIKRTCICHKNISIDTFHCSFKLNWKLVAVKLLFLFIEIMIKGEDCWFPVTYFHAVSCTILLWSQNTFTIVYNLQTSTFWLLCYITSSVCVAFLTVNLLVNSPGAALHLKCHQVWFLSAEVCSNELHLLCYVYIYAF